MNNEEDKNDKKKYYYNRNNNINKGLHYKNRSPILSPQENNFYYNTKINHLIFHDYSNNNIDKNNCEQSNIPYNNSMCIKYDISDSNLNEGKNIISGNFGGSYYKNSISLKKLEKFKNMKIDLNETEINMNTKINQLGTNTSTTRSKNPDNSYINNLNSGNNTTTYNNMRNRHNPFNINNFKKKNNVNNNENEKEINNNNNNSQNIKNYPVRSLKNVLPKNNIVNSNAFIDMMSYKNINNNYFYNIQNNFEKNDNKEMKKNLLENNNIFLSNFTSINSTKNINTNCKKIPLKNEKIGNYQIKSPGSSNTHKINFNKIENKINKSPEIPGNKKIKYSFIKNSKNKFSNAIKSNKELNNENNKDNNNKKKIINVNMNNKKNKLNNNENRNTKRNIINNINIYNSLPKKNTTNNINEKNINKEKVNNNETHVKINQKNIKNKINYYYNQLNEIPKKSNNKKINSSMNNKLKKFCDILEQLFYVSFKNNFKNFIQKIKQYIDYNNFKRALIIRRFESVKKINNNNLNNINSLSNSFYNASNDNNYQKIKMNSLINEKLFQNKLRKSPSKFLELQDNIQSSMMHINQDNYIQMFNDLFMKERDYSLNKRCRSPLIERNIKDSLNINDISENSAYDKYKTKTNITNEFLYFPKKNNNKCSNIKKINLEKNYINSINTNKNGFIGNIFDDDNINDQLKNNFSIDNNLKRDHSNVQLIDEPDRISFNKNMLLYSKPILKKSINNVPNSNMNIINFQKNGRNNFTNSMRNIISTCSKNFSSNKKSSNHRSKIIELNNIKNIDENKKEFTKNEIIVKNIHTKDKRLNVFIKYIKIQNYKTKKSFREKLVNSHTDSISLNSKYFDKDNIINLRNNHLNKNKKRNINDIKKEIEDKNQQETINNNSYEDENTKIIYLINFLQNMLNDNKKTILYNFWKNLQKIKTNCILQNSINSKSKIKSNKFKEKKFDKKNIIELPKYNNNNFTKIKPLTKIVRNKEKDEEKSLEVNIIKSRQNIIEKTDHTKNEISSLLYNKSSNNLFAKKNKKFEEKIIINEKDNSTDETIKKEQLKKIKLAKLGKLFKNLEQENNLINTIKEQFLDWTNKQDANIKQDKEQENIDKQDDLKDDFDK